MARYVCVRSRVDESSLAAEIWNSIGPLSEVVLSGTPVSKEDDFLLFRQLPHQGNGIFEAYHSWMWVPVAQEDGSFGGLWNATIETTKKVLAERRMASVREMGERTCEQSLFDLRVWLIFQRLPER
jgi:hypothetical protein